MGFQYFVVQEGNGERRLVFIDISIMHLRTHFYRLAINIFFDFQLQAVAQVGICSLPVGLA